MPDRIIRESICTSGTIDKLSWFEEVFWHRLTVNCDDFGRFDARAAVLKNRLFPLKDTGVTKKCVENALNKLASVGLVTPYVCDGKPYLQISTWEKYQRVRATKSKYPDPCADFADICRQLPSNVPVSENRESNASIAQNAQNVGESDSSSTTSRKDAFVQFWAIYPKKRSKGDAEKAFRAIKPDDQLLGAMIAAVEKQRLSRDWTKDGGQFIPYPATWLRAKGWEDESDVQSQSRRTLT